jgi:hypothetical protein
MMLSTEFLTELEDVKIRGSGINLIFNCIYKNQISHIMWPLVIMTSLKKEGLK